MRYLIDTSIWIDLYEDRKGYNNEPLGEYALKFFYKVMSNKDIVIITELLIKELSTFYSISEIDSMIKPFKKETIRISKSQIMESNEIARQRNIPSGDALYTIIARDNNLMFITRDRHFKRLRDISEHYKPEDII